MDPDPVEAQVLFADCRAPGPVNPSIGWKVKDVVTAPGSAEVGRGLLQAVDAIGQAYVPDIELAQADRSAEASPVLKQVRLDGDVMLLAHFADAGIDRTGRASHTMHGLLHNAALRAATGQFRRPMELFGSPMWLRPIGNDAVEAASVQECRFDLPTGQIGLDDVIGDPFLTDLDHPERVAMLPVVIEAFLACLAGDVTAVLVVSSALESAQWLALLSNLVDPVSAGRLQFSTREDLLSAATVDGWDYHLAAVVRSGVPRAGRDQLASLGSRFIVLETERAPRDTADATWTLGDGSVLTRSDWTDLAETVLMSPVVTAGVRSRLDQLAAGVIGIHADPSWALPAAALLAGVDLPDPDPAVRWVFDRWPADAMATDALVEELGAAVAHVVSASDTLSTELSDRVGRGVPTALADAVLAGAVRRALAGPASGTAIPTLSRPLSRPAAAAIDAELTGLLAWVQELPVADRLDALLRVVAFAESAGLSGPAVVAAVLPTIDLLVRAIVDPTFDPAAAGWPSLPPVLWRDIVADRVSDALSVADGSAEVSPATHEWLTPSLGPRDRPEAVATSRRLDMTGYANRRAAWHGASSDPWASAVFAVGMMHVNTLRLGMSPEEGVGRAMERAFAGHPIPVDVAEAILAVIDTAQSNARLQVASAALVDGEFRPDQQRLAESLRPDVNRCPLPMDPSVAPVYLQLVHSQLTRGVTATVLDPTTLRAVGYIADSLPTVQVPALHEAARIMLLQWGLRLPVSAVCGPSGAAADDRPAAALRAVVPDTDGLDRALQLTLRRHDATVIAALAPLLTRTALAMFYESPQAPYDPFRRYLSLRDDRDAPRILRGPVAAWLADRGKPAYMQLSAAWDRVIDELVGKGWQTRLTQLDEDKAQAFEILQSRSVLGRLRSRR